MGLMDQLGNVLGKYGSEQGTRSDDEVHRDFDQIAPQASSSSLSRGLASAFRSDKTPPFAEMLGGMFGQASGQQRAGLLNTLIATVGARNASRILGDEAGGLLAGGGAGTLSPEQAEQIPHRAVSALAREAEQRDPSVVDKISNFSAAHPGLVKAIGAGALGILLSHVARHGQQS